MVKKTADEKFLLKIYEIAMRNKDPFSEVDILTVGMEIGEKGKKIANIVRLLCNCNFVKKVGESIVLTQKGVNLAKKLKS